MLDFLKKNTQSTHKETELSNLAKYIMDHSITLENYKELLIRNYYAYYTTEQLLVNSVDHVDTDLKQFIGTHKSELLSTDLKSLNVPIDTSLCRLSDEDYTLQSEAEIIGTLYVLEGSMLGGMLISKNLPKCESLKHIKTHHFFSKNPTILLDRWKAFREVVEGKYFNKHDEQKALNAAKKTFLTFREFQTIPLK